MPTYLLTPAADSDIEEIWQYIAAERGARRANVVEDDLHAAMLALASAPGLGHLRTDLADEALPFHSLHSYLIIY